VNYITYSENGSWCGYLVRVPGGTQRLFSVGKLGASAERAAIAERDAQMRRLGISGPKHYREKFSRNTSGTVGVKRVRYISRQYYKRRIYEYLREIWVAEWWRDGKLNRRTFSINKYGTRRAKALAIQAREKGIRSSWRT
jgi:AP2 domain.